MNEKDQGIDMSAIIKNFLKEMSERRAVANWELPRMTATELTKLSWARRVESCAEVPNFFMPFFTHLTVRTGAFPYTVRTPSYEGFLTRTTEKLVCFLDPELYILEKAGDQLKQTAYCPQDIHQIEVGEILLNSWIKISGTTKNGSSTSTSFKFNTVSDYLFTPILEKIRPARRESEESSLKAERSKFDYLTQSHYKFMNQAKKCILPGESVLLSIMQPEIRAEIAALFGCTLSRKISPAHIVILTDTELIVFREDFHRQWGGDVRYGGIWNFIPLEKILGCALAEKGKDLLVLSIQLPGEDHLETSFSTSNRPEVECLLQRLAALGKKPGFFKD